MLRAEVDEILSIVGRVTTVVLSTIPSKGIAAPALKQIVGKMQADDNMAHIATYSTALIVALDISRLSGASLASMSRVRVAAIAETPRFLGGVATKLATIRLCLAQEARVAASLTFRSRDDVDRLARTMTAAFEEAALVAADDLDAGTYRAIVETHSTVVKFLTDQGRLKPRVVNYTTPDPQPALRISQRLYGTGGRSQEIADENKVVHPAFCPTLGRALAL